MYVIIVGCGQIGFQLTRSLLAAGNEVVAIESDSRRADAATELLGSVVLASDGTEPSVLREAGAARCDTLVATTGSDADNLVACQVAKAAFQVARTVAVVHDPEHVSLFNSLGVDVTINTSDLILSHIAAELPADVLMHRLPLVGSGKTVVGVRLPPDAQAVGRTLSDIALPPGSAVALVVGKDGHLRKLDASLQFEAGDEVVAVTSPEDEEQLWQALTKG